METVQAAAEEAKAVERHLVLQAVIYEKLRGDKDKKKRKLIPTDTTKTSAGSPMMSSEKKTRRTPD